MKVSQRQYRQIYVSFRITENYIISFQPIKISWKSPSIIVNIIFWKHYSFKFNFICIKFICVLFYAVNLLRRYGAFPNFTQGANPGCSLFPNLSLVQVCPLLCRSSHLRCHLHLAKGLPMNLVYARFLLGICILFMWWSPCVPVASRRTITPAVHEKTTDPPSSLVQLYTLVPIRVY